MKKLAGAGKKFVLSILLTAAMLFGGTTALTKTPEEENGATFKTANISSTFNEASDVKTIKSPTPTDSIFYPSRDLAPKLYTFVDQPLDQVPPPLMVLRASAEALKTSKTIIGPSLAKLSKEMDIRYCYGDLATEFGKWRGDQGVIYIEQGDRMLAPVLQFSVLTHELTHAMQQRNGVGIAPMNRPIQEIQLVELTKEAAGEVCEFLMALEMRENGFEEHWKCLEALYKERANQILAVWDSAKAAGLPYDQALALTGKTAFYQQFEQKTWLLLYNTRFLLKYMKSIDAGILQPIGGAEIGLTEISKMGYISPEFNFTADIDSLPGAGKGIYGNSKRMAYAFDRVELWRLEVTEGMESAAYKNLYSRMKETDKNPYLVLDMREVLNMCEKGKFYPVAVMEILLKQKLNAPPQPNNKPAPK